MTRWAVALSRALTFSRWARGAFAQNLRADSSHLIDFLLDLTRFAFFCLRFEPETVGSCENDGDLSSVSCTWFKSCDDAWYGFVSRLISLDGLRVMEVRTAKIFWKVETFWDLSCVWSIFFPFWCHVLCESIKSMRVSTMRMFEKYVVFSRHPL